MSPYVDALDRRGVPAVAIDLPHGNATRAVPAYRTTSGADQRDVVGGRSYGGRVASLLAAESDVCGVLLISYPLHRPGGSEWQDRTSHWPRIRCPVLLLSGDSDPFAQIPLLRAAVRQLKQGELVVFPGAGHGITEALDEAMDRAAEWFKGLRVAADAR
jgi:predicted alpha/beta-hydrolase family hydrolase